MVEETARMLIVRHRSGIPVEVPANFDIRLREIATAIRGGKTAEALVEFTNDRLGHMVAVGSTWQQLVAELFLEYSRRSDHDSTHVEPLLRVLEALASEGAPSASWERVRGVILDNIDTLSGWQQSGLSRDSSLGDIERRDGRYFGKLNGEEVEVVGARTAVETRWDFIFDDVNRGLLHALLRVVALRNVCADFHVHPAAYPAAIRIYLWENGHTWFLQWQWQVPWPYQRKYLPWCPECPQCSVEWLASDLLARFADCEHIPGRDTAETHAPDEVQVFEERTRKWPCQWEFALDTSLQFGDGAETWFTFRNHPLRWINRTPYVLTMLVVPSDSLSHSDRYYRIALEFISALVFKHRSPVRIVTWLGSARRQLPMLRQPHQFGSLIMGPAPSLPGQYASGSPKALAVSLYAEALNSGSVRFSHLCSGAECVANRIENFLNSCAKPRLG